MLTAEPEAPIVHPTAPVNTWTFHHDDPMIFHHDEHVPMHIPTAKIAADNLAHSVHQFQPNVHVSHVPQPQHVKTI